MGSENLGLGRVFKIHVRIFHIVATFTLWSLERKAQTRDLYLLFHIDTKFDNISEQTLTIDKHIEYATTRLKGKQKSTLLPSVTGTHRIVGEHPPLPKPPFLG